MTAQVCRECQAPIRWVRPRWRKGGAMPLDEEPVTRTEVKPLQFDTQGNILRRATEGEPLTGRLCHFDTCTVRLAKLEAR